MPQRRPGHRGPHLHLPFQQTREQTQPFFPFFFSFFIGIQLIYNPILILNVQRSDLIIKHATKCLPQEVYIPCYHTKILQYYWLYPLSCTSIPMTDLFFIISSLYLFIPFTYFAHPLPSTPNASNPLFSAFMGLRKWQDFLLFYSWVIFQKMKVLPFTLVPTRWSHLIICL